MSGPFLAQGDYINVKDFGAAGDGKQPDAVPIQDAIKQAIAKNIPNIYLPKGFYKTETTIYLGWGDGYRTLNLVGPYGTTPRETGAWICPVFTDRPCVNMQGGRDCGIYGVGFLYEPMYQRVSAVISGATQNFPDDPAEWNPLALDPDHPEKRVAPLGLRRYSPFCAIAIDAFTKTPGMPYVQDKTLKYPYLTDSGVPPDYTVAADGIIRPSSQCYIENCTIVGFCVGIVTEPCGSDGNGEFVKIKNCQISCGSYGISICHTQCRTVEIRNCNFSFLHTAVDNSTFGLQSGHLGGSIDLCSTAMCYQALNIGTATSHVMVKGLHVESTVRIGVFSSGFGTFKSGITFEGCGFSFVCGTGPDSGPPTIPDAYFWVSGPTPVKFDTCSFMSNRFLVIRSEGQVVLENCSWSTGRDYIFDNTIQNNQNHGATASAGVATGYNQFGGLFIVDLSGDGGFRPKLIGRCEGATRIYDSGTGSLSFTSQSFQADCFASMSQNSAGGVDAMGMIHPAAEAYRDNDGRRWPILYNPIPQVLGLGNFSDYPQPLPGTIPGKWGLSISGVMKVDNRPFVRFTRTIDEGDVLFHEGTGNVYIVNIVQHKPELDGTDYLAYKFTAVQQNNYSVSDQTKDNKDRWGFVDGQPLKVPLLGPNTGTQWRLHKAIRLPTYMYFGDFVKGSTTVKHVHRGNSYSDINHIPIGMPIAENVDFLGSRPDSWALTGNYLMASDGNTRITGRKGDSGGQLGCELTLSKEASISGRLPIFPVPLVGLNVQNPAMSARINGRFTLSGSGGAIKLDQVTENSRIMLTPKNAAAAAIMGSSQCLYVSAQAIGSFSVATADGKVPPTSAGPAEFEYSLEA